MIPKQIRNILCSVEQKLFELEQEQRKLLVLWSKLDMILQKDFLLRVSCSPDLLNSSSIEIHYFLLVLWVLLLSLECFATYQSLSNTKALGVLLEDSWTWSLLRSLQLSLLLWLLVSFLLLDNSKEERFSVSILQELTLLDEFQSWFLIRQEL